MRALAIRLKNRRIRGLRLVLDDVRPLKERVGWFQFSVAAIARGGRRAAAPAMTAIASSGGRGVKPWIEARFLPTIELDGEKLRTRGAGLQDELIAVMGAVIPPGGHLMIDYESGGQERTMRELQLGIPPAATSLGARMLAAGFVGEFKDWYFSEGGHEGPRKLQANKPPDTIAKRRAVEARSAELRSFQSTAPQNSDAAELREALTVAQRRAEILIDHLKQGRAARKTIETLSTLDLSPASKARRARSADGRGRRLPPAPSR